MEMEFAETFIKYDYTETKDLLKTFITLISATLVLPLTFSEKIVRFDKAAPGTRYRMLMSWVLFIIALVFSGIGMVSIAAAAGKAIYPGTPFLFIDVMTFSYISWIFVLASGVTYVLGLVALTAAAAAGTNDHPST
jgi:hypothetical protein